MLLSPTTYHQLMPVVVVVVVVEETGNRYRHPKLQSCADKFLNLEVDGKRILKAHI